MKRFSLAGLGSLALFAAGCAETVNTNPVARIEVQGTPRVNTPLVFDASASVDAEGAIKSYRFDFGDGSEIVSGVSRAEHAFTEAGVYTVTLTVTDQEGLRDSNRVEVTVAGNRAPQAILNGPVLATVGQRVTFDGAASTDEDGRIVSYAIDFGDGNQGANPQESHIYQAPGVYDVVLTVTDNEEATASVTRTIQVLTGAEAAGEAPLARLTVASSASALEVLTFDASLSTTPGATAQYRVYFGDGQSGNGRSLNHAYSVAGNYTAVLMVTATYPDGSTAVSMDARQVSVQALNTVHAKPSAEMTAPASARFGSTVAFDASASVAPNAVNIDYAWNFGDGNTGSGPLATHSFTTPGLYIVRLSLTATYADGTSTQVNQSKVLTVVGNAAPVAVISGPSEGLVSDELIFSSAQSNDPDGALVSTAWTFSDATNFNTPAITKPFAAPGVYEVSLTVTDNDGDTHTATQLVTIRSYNAVAELPQATLNGPVQLTAGQTGAFMVAGSSVPSGAATYKFYFGDGNTASGPVANHAYAAPGNYLASVLLVATYPDGTSNMSLAYLPVEVISGSSANPAPVAEFSAPAKVRFSETVAVDAGLSTAPGAASVSYAWDFGDTTTANGPTATHSFAPGIYTVTLDVTATYADGSAATARRQRIIEVAANVPPVARLAGDTNGLASQALSFNAAESSDADGTIVSYAIDFGDGSPVVNASAASHVFAAAGVYHVTLTVTDNDGATATAVRTVTISPYNTTAEPPVAVLNGPTALGVGQSGVFTSAGSTAPGAVRAYRIDFGDGNVSNDPAAAHSYAAAGDYVVTLVLTATYPDGTSNASTAVLPVAVTQGSSSNPAPTPIISAPTTIRYDETLVVDASASSAEGAAALEYLWSFGDGNAATGMSAAHTYAAPSGTFGIRLTVIATYADATTSYAQAVKFVQLTPNKAPVAQFTAPLVVTAGDIVGVDASTSSDADGSIVSYAFDFGDGQTSSNPVASVVYAAAGTYEITLTVTDNDGATATAVREIRVRSEAEAAEAPIARLSAPATGYINEIINLDGSASTPGSSPIAGFYWELGDGRDLTGGASINVTYATRGSYTVQLAVTDATGLSASAQRQITIVNRAPSINSVTVGDPFTTVFFPNTPIAVHSVNGWYDADGDPVGYRYQWFVNGYPVFGETSDTFGGSLIPGDLLYVQVAPYDGFDEGTPVESASILIQAPENPQNLDIGTGPFYVNDTLIASVSNPSASFEYEWYVDGILAGPGDTLSGAFMKHQEVYVRARTVEDAYAGPWVESARVIIQNSLPVITDVAIGAGPFYETSTITATATMTDADGDVPALTYQWFVDGSPVKMGPSIDGADFDKGADVFVRVTADDGDATDVADSATVTILNTAPTAVGFVIAQALPSETIYANELTPATDPDPADTLAVTYAWYKNGVAQGFPDSQAIVSGDMLTDGDVWKLVITVDDGSAAPVTSFAERTIEPPHLFTSKGSLAEPRNGARVVALNDGNALVVGGRSGSETLDSAEVYFANAGTFGTVSPMAVKREQHTATLLQDGRVLVVGGYYGGPLGIAEIYDPATGSFSGAGFNGIPAAPRYAHTATLLEDGTVLIAGGYDEFGETGTAELYDPVNDEFIPLAATMNTPRTNHQAIRLQNGNVLLLGGFVDDTQQTVSSEIYDVASGDFIAGPDMATSRTYFEVAALPDGRILVAGGFFFDGLGSPIYEAEIYDPVTNLFRSIAPLTYSRFAHTVTVLPSGLVLIAGDHEQAELFDPATETFSLVSNAMIPRLYGSAVLLTNGKVLLVAGETNFALQPVAQEFR